MSNMTITDNASAFHPGYYIAELIEDMGISQAEFAVRMGTTEKTLSNLVNGKCRLSNDLAQKIAAMMGTSVDVWLNLQKSYDESLLQIERDATLDAQISIMDMIDYSFFVKVANLPDTRSKRERIVNLCGFLKVFDLRVMMQPDFLINFRSGVNELQEKNIVNSQIWVQTAINFAENIRVNSFSAKQLKDALPQIRAMTVQPMRTFLPELRRIFAECGVAFVLLDHLKNSGVHGAVKWKGQDKVILALNNRRLYADSFWFSLFHEIKHVLQQKLKTVFVFADENALSQYDHELEDEADAFARDYLIPKEKYEALHATRYIADAEIKEFADEIGIHEGIVVGRLQKDGIISQARSNRLKIKYEIPVN